MLCQGQRKLFFHEKWNLFEFHVVTVMRNTFCVIRVLKLKKKKRKFVISATRKRRTVTQKKAEEIAHTAQNFLGIYWCRKNSVLFRHIIKYCSSKYTEEWDRKRKF